MARDVNYDININDQGSQQTLGQLEQMAADLNEQIRNVDRNSEAFQTLSGEIQQVNLQLEMANSEIEGFTERRRIMAMQGAIDVFAGGIEAASGLAVQLGISNDEFEEVVQNLLAVQSTANGIRTVTQGVADLREATRGLTLAQLRFNTAALANPYVLAAAVIVTAIAAVVTQFDEFRRAVGDVGIDLPDFSATWERVGNIVGGVAAVIANQLGHLTGGFVRLLSGDFSGAFESFSNLGLGGLASGEIQNAFTRGSTPEPDEPDTEAITEQTKEVGTAAVEGAACGVEETIERLPVETVSTLQAVGIVPTNVDVETPDGDEIADNIGVTAAMNAQDALDTFEEDIAQRKLDREERLTNGLRTLFADNVEISKAIAIAEGAVAAGRSVKDTISSIRTINANASAIPPILPPGVPNPAYAPAQAARVANVAIEGALGALDLAAIVSNTQQTISALEGGGTFNPTPGGVSTPGFAGPTVQTPDALNPNLATQQQTEAIQNMMTQMGSIQAVVAAGDIQNETERTARANNKRRLRRNG